MGWVEEHHSLSLCRCRCRLLLYLTCIIISVLSTVLIISVVLWMFSCHISSSSKAGKGQSCTELKIRCIISLWQKCFLVWSLFQLLLTFSTWFITIANTEFRFPQVCSSPTAATQAVTAPTPLEFVPPSTVPHTILTPTCSEMLLFTPGSYFCYPKYKYPLTTSSLFQTRNL